MRCTPSGPDMLLQELESGVQTHTAAPWLFQNPSHAPRTAQPQQKDHAAAQQVASGHKRIAFVPQWEKDVPL